jgi:hypothetical protein
MTSNRQVGTFCGFLFRWAWGDSKPIEVYARANTLHT